MRARYWNLCKISDLLIYCMNVKMEPLQKFGFCNGSVICGKKGRF